MSRTVAGGRVRPPNPLRDAERKESKGKLNGNEVFAGGVIEPDKGRVLLATAVGTDCDTDCDCDDAADDDAYEEEEVVVERMTSGLANCSTSNRPCPGAAATAVGAVTGTLTVSVLEF